MRVRLGCFGALIAVCVAAMFAVSAPIASAAGTEECGNIVGSGSSLQFIAQTKVFIPGFTTEGGWEENCKEAPTIEYTATSSGEGLKEFGDEGTLGGAKNESPFPAFVGTDVGPEGPATGEEAKTKKTQMFEMDEAGEEGATKNEVMTVPIAQSAVAVIVSLPAKCKLEHPTVKATITDKVLEETWLKDNKKWSFPLLKAIGVKAEAACEVVPTLEARSKASGTTAGFKRFMDDIEPTEWNAFTKTAAEAESTNWPFAGTKKESGSGGELAEKVFKTPGTIGYADLADAVAKGFTATPQEHGEGEEKYYSFIVEVQNNSGEETATFGSPSKTPASIKTGGANCENATYEEPASVGMAEVRFIRSAH
jgi:ABC-type phosphate transport system substrate-binding protein